MPLTLSNPKGSFAMQVNLVHLTKFRMIHVSKNITIEFKTVVLMTFTSILIQIF